METWKTIIGYEGIYEISDHGRIKSTKRDKILKTKTKNVNRGTREDVGLSKDGKYKTYSVHRLVLSTFNPVNNMDVLEVDHIDENALNNVVGNLQWVTPLENKELYHKRRGRQSKACPHCGGKI